MLVVVSSFTTCDLRWKNGYASGKNDFKHQDLDIQLARQVKEEENLHRERQIEENRETGVGGSCFG